MNPVDETTPFRLWLLAQFFTRKRVQAVSNLIGRHHKNVSILYLLLGAKVGTRVFWPGSHPSYNRVYDLLEVGNDVVFGAHSTLLTMSIGRCVKIIMCAGANVSDNCIVMPGSVISKNAVLGSYSICPEGKLLLNGSVWFGSTGAES
jgi:acetyltransferase-like isoleucine patch superfamily enzyme